ncbi:MAG: hypothetical protein KF780_11025 [Sphingomonas sp.]|nr:hypothetical protein [Sphingomonas sp.]
MAEREKEVIVTSDGGGSGGLIVVVLLLLAVIVGLFFMFGSNLMGDGKTDINADVKIETPAAPAPSN